MVVDRKDLLFQDRILCYRPCREKSWDPYATILKTADGIRGTTKWFRCHVSWGIELSLTLTDVAQEVLIRHIILYPMLHSFFATKNSMLQCHPVWSLNCSTRKSFNWILIVWFLQVVFEFCLSHRRRSQAIPPFGALCKLRRRNLFNSQDLWRVIKGSRYPKTSSFCND